MDLMKIIQSQLTETVMDQLAKQVGGNREQATTASNGILNALVGAMSKNAAKDEKSAANLFNALEKDHDGSLLDNLSDFINPAKPDPVNERSANGLGIIGHLLGDKAGAISKLIGQQSGLSSEGTMGLMTKLAPIIMATLGKQKQQSGFQITDLMGLLTNQGQQIRKEEVQSKKSGAGIGDMLKMLDFDGDGSGLDDAMGMLGKLFGK
ncbi:MAG: hypothetical protein ACI94Y_003745 [Maribacter sp.]|jgi:hypothetical protein